MLIKTFRTKPCDYEESEELKVMWWSALVLLLVVGRSAASSCEEARLRCAYRSGCGTALNNYMMLCNEVLAQPSDTCPEGCEHALIALTSTEEGKELMTCKCEDAYCVDAKQKINVCRAQVLKGAANVSSSCRLSQLICQADAQCRTALDYYNEYCRSVYRGRKCSKKCLNSIQILRKQEKAAALTACQCDGNEDYDCPKMQSNLDRLCFHKHHKNHTKNHEKSFEQRHKKTQHSHSAAERILVSVLLIITLCISLTSNS
ncbi:growth arrest-specific protein 1-like [Leptidea sinapis]|uniref:growth arrest-specific protein 1-like n=1 Tax=Leptidea sinapis TaxID=189913 RepID=UPI0021C47C8A|nr:growth arrest-specific protein 1-like [Leptidea sinapis]